MSLPADLHRALGELAGRERILLALDFDGVLAPIVARPEAARPLPASREPLERLSRTPGVTLALVSGRALASLCSVASPPDGAVLVGSHGAETGTGDGDEAVLDSERAALLQRVVDALEEVVSTHPGTAVETKPAGAVLHTRGAERPVADAATSAVLQGPADWPGVHVTRGKEVVELSVVSTDKGRAVQRLRADVGADAVLYVGDDVTDEHAFGVLEPGAGDVGVKVGDGDTAAAYRVADPEQVAELLVELAALRR